MHQTFSDSDEEIAFDVANKALSEPLSPMRASTSASPIAVSECPEEVLALLKKEFDLCQKRGYEESKAWLAKNLENGILSGRLRVPLDAQSRIATTIGDLAKKSNKPRAARLWNRAALLLSPSEWRVWSIAAKLGTI
jgi:hypothetical protein